MPFRGNIVFFLPKWPLFMDLFYETRVGSFPAVPLVRTFIFPVSTLKNDGDENGTRSLKSDLPVPYLHRRTTG